MINDPRIFHDPERLQALRENVAVAREEDSSEFPLLPQLKALEHYLGWATRLDDLSKHEDRMQPLPRHGDPKFIRKPIPGSLSAERLEVVDEIQRLEEAN